VQEPHEAVQFAFEKPFLIAVGAKPFAASSVSSAGPIP
jgi:hypothetical protein